LAVGNFGLGLDIDRVLAAAETAQAVMAAAARN